MIWHVFSGSEKNKCDNNKSSPMDTNGCCDPLTSYNVTILSPEPISTIIQITLNKAVDMCHSEATG